MRWRSWFLLGYLWSLPATLLGLALAAFYWPRAWRWSDGCIEAIGGERIWFKPGAQTHGFLIYYADEKARDWPSLRVHERVHVAQGFVGGPLFMFAYGAAFLWHWARGGFGDWRPAYLANPFERQAYRIQDEFQDGLRLDAWGGRSE